MDKAAGETEQSALSEEELVNLIFAKANQRPKPFNNSCCVLDALLPSQAIISLA
jgi:hypothetical protein